LLAKRLPMILRPLTPVECLETTRIYNPMGRFATGQPMVAVLLFCAPREPVTDAGLAGGGQVPQPVRLTLAHKGVL
jgi:magnesium chelatase family protein